MTLLSIRRLPFRLRSQKCLIDCSLVRQVMAVRRQTILDANQADYRSSGYLGLQTILLEISLGSSFWDKWFAASNFNVVCFREILP